MTPGCGLQRGICSLSFAALVCLFPAASCPGGSPVRTVAHYKVSTKGFSIGDVSATQNMSEDDGVARVHFETRTTVKASFLWMAYHQDTIEKGTLRQGQLVSYARTGSDNGTAVHVEGRLDHQDFRFDIREQGRCRSVTIPRSSYDYTTMECPEAHIDFTGRQQVALKVLDVEKLAVVKREYRLVGTERYSVDGREYPCRVVDFSDPNKKARRWISWDGTAVVMYRQDSRDKSSYSVQATSVRRLL